MRKTKIVPIVEEGRDAGKHFFITEMPAMQAEKWAARAYLALAHAGVEIPDNVAGLGVVGVLVIGLKAFVGLKFDEAEPLMDEMFTCVQFIPDPHRPEVMRPPIDDDIEEPSTLIHLRKEIFELHVNFTYAELLSKLASVSAAKNSQA